MKNTPIPIDRLSTRIASADNAISIPAGAIPTNPKIRTEIRGNGKFNNIKKLQYFGSGNVDNQLEATSIGYPSWWVLDAQIGYSYSENSKLNIGVFNILDIHYKTFASGISSPGRSLMLSLKLAI